MSKQIRLTVLTLALLGLLFAGLQWRTPQTAAGQPTQRIALGVQPAFAANSALPLGEIGISAWLDTGELIVLDDVRSEFEVIEAESSTYLIGLVAVPNYEDQQNEAYHAHVYVSTDGWLLAYYPNTDPAAKIIDWKAYYNSGANASIGTVLELVLGKVAVAANAAYTTPTFYDFRHPNATHMLLVADLTAPNDPDTFRIQLPAENNYDETSWSMYKNSTAASYWEIDGSIVAGSNPCNYCIGWGFVTISEGIEHTIDLDYTGGLAVIYEEQ